MNNLEKEIRYAVFTPVFGVRSDIEKKFFFEKIKIIKDHKKVRRLLMIIHEKKNKFFGTDLS
jgi:hypothetical protein